MNAAHTKNISFNFLDVPHTLRIYSYDDPGKFHQDIKGKDNYHPDAIAYSETYSVQEMRNLSACIYLYHADPGTIAHEAVHVSLGILARHGTKSIPATTEAAPEVEEQLADLVGSITEFVMEEIK